MTGESFPMHCVQPCLGLYPNREAHIVQVKPASFGILHLGQSAAKCSSSHRSGTSAIKGELIKELQAFPRSHSRSKPFAGTAAWHRHVWAVLISQPSLDSPFLAAGLGWSCASWASWLPRAVGKALPAVSSETSPGPAEPLLSKNTKQPWGQRLSCPSPACFQGVATVAKW